MDLRNSIEKIEIDTNVIYNNKEYQVTKNTFETVTLKPINGGYKISVPFYSCNKIQNLEGAYF